MNMTEFLIESLFETLEQFPRAPHVKLAYASSGPVPAGICPGISGVIVCYEEEGKIHIASFDGDEKPYADEKESDSGGCYRARRDAASLIVKKGREGTLRLILYPAYLEYFAPRIAV